MSVCPQLFALNCLPSTNENPLYTQLTPTQCSSAGVAGDVALGGYDADKFGISPDTNRVAFERALASFLGRPGQPVTAANIEVAEVTNVAAGAAAAAGGGAVVQSGGQAPAQVCLFTL